MNTGLYIATMLNMAAQQHDLPRNPRRGSSGAHRKCKECGEPTRYGRTFCTEFCRKQSKKLGSQK